MLAADSLGGRAAGSPEGARAAAYVARRLAEAPTLELPPFIERLPEGYGTVRCDMNAANGYDPEQLRAATGIEHAARSPAR